MYKEQKIKCASCGKLFVSDINATLCPKCSENVDNIG